jgi:putative spermidine/putrescine transport system substrate-binding protein
MRRTIAACFGAPLPRRTLLGGAALLAAPALITRRAQAAETCVVGTWGGDYARLLRENIDDPLMKPQGIDVVQDVADETPRVAKLFASRRLPHGSVDVACVGSPQGFRCAEAGLLETIDEASVPNVKYLRSELKSNTFIPHIYSAQVLVYNPQTVTDPPKTFGDLLDPKWKGKVGLIGGNSFWAMMGASLYTSGNPNDFEKAKEYMLKLNDNGLRLYPTTDSLAPAFKSGEIEVGVVWQARVYMWQNGGFPVASLFPKEGAILYVSGMIVPKNAPNKAAALKYINALLDPAAQQGFAAHMGYLPTVDNAPLTGKVAEQLAFPTPMPKLVQPDYAITTKIEPSINDWWLKNIQHS